MQNTYFLDLESIEEGDSYELSEVIDRLSFNENGLVPAIAQCIETDEVLMMAWMNKEAIVQTIETGIVTYWSRSRNNFWVKGETSGHIQSLKQLLIDCDGDTILCKVHQKGAACHTMRRTCFYLEVDTDNSRVHLAKR